MENLKIFTSNEIKEELKKININNVVFFDTEFKEELKTIYDNRQSFYKKALIHKNYTNNIIALQSYNTMITAKIYMHNNYYLIFNDYYINSATTQRHIKEFLKQYIFNYDMINFNITSDDIYFISNINFIEDIKNYFYINNDIRQLKASIKHFKDREIKTDDDIKKIDFLKGELKTSKNRLKTLLNNYNI